MRDGDFESAWRQTDRIELPRRQVEAEGRVAEGSHHLVWNGEPFDGRRVLVRCEHGLGDTLQYVRYIGRLRERARQVILKVQPALLEILTDFDGADTVINGWTSDPDPPHDLQIECMEFSYAFRDTAETIPAYVPYLPVQRILGRSRLALHSSGTRRIGLVWAASSWDLSRSINAMDLALLRTVPGVTYFSLQQDSESHTALTSLPELQILAPVTGAVIDAAAAMLQLDLIITVDSMTAHLAGALGRPVWLILKHEADWRWMDVRSDSPWYPSMCIFRQPSPGDWRGALGQVACALEEDPINSGEQGVTR